MTFTLNGHGLTHYMFAYFCPDNASLDRSTTHLRHDSCASSVNSINSTAQSLPRQSVESSQSMHGAVCNCQAYPVCENEEHDHRPKVYGRHGDIHPGNMLWFSPKPNDKKSLGGTLKIADFGQAELNCYMSKTKPRSVAHTVTYRPPENDVPNARISQVYDIWGLGCVYLEFVAWLLGGAKLVKKLSAQRLAPDLSRNRDSTDTFFQTIDPTTLRRELKIKDKVVQVRDPKILIRYSSNLKKSPSKSCTTTQTAPNTSMNF